MWEWRGVGQYQSVHFLYNYYCRIKYITHTVCFFFLISRLIIVKVEKEGQRGKDFKYRTQT